MRIKKSSKAAVRKIAAKAFVNGFESEHRRVHRGELIETEELLSIPEALAGKCKYCGKTFAQHCSEGTLHGGCGPSILGALISIVGRDHTLVG